MKAKRLLLFLVMAICLASELKAQFYDSADDIYYYVETLYECPETHLRFSIYGSERVKTGRIITKTPEDGEAKVLIFNFDGKKAVELSGFLNGNNVSGVKGQLRNNPSYYEDKVETTEYNLEYCPSLSTGTVYRDKYYVYRFSSDRSTMTYYSIKAEEEQVWTLKRVDKSYFKVGRSRTPSSTLHE